jgi:YgiT-type zinc finger domain-containing protein
MLIAHLAAKFLRVSEEEGQIRRRVCAGLLESRVTDLPFKVGDSAIVILRSLPVLECRQCRETELEQATMARVDQLLAAVDASAELEVIRYDAVESSRDSWMVSSRRKGPLREAAGYNRPGFYRLTRTLFPLKHDTPIPIDIRQAPVPKPHVRKPVEEAPGMSVPAGHGMSSCFVDKVSLLVSIHDSEPIVKRVCIVEWPLDRHAASPVDVVKYRGMTNRRQALRKTAGNSEPRLDHNR